MASDTESWESDDSLDPGEATELQSRLREAAHPLQAYPVPHVARPGDKLCETCTKLELNPDRFLVRPGDPEWKQSNRPDNRNIPLGLVSEIESRKECPFCRLVLVSLGGTEGVPSQDDLTGEALRVDLSWDTDGPTPDPNTPWHHLPEVRLLRPYVRTQSGGFPRSVGLTLNLFPEITLLANDAPKAADGTPTGADFFPRVARPDAIDFAMVRRWLALCSLHHGIACRESVSLKELGLSHPTLEISSFRCIDVEKSCLVIAPTRCRYAALSYVWGVPGLFTTLKENVGQLEKPGAFNKPEYWDRIPATVRDAVIATRELRIPYLWVDSLCIIQDEDQAEKMKHIMLMGTVYSAADLVIIAAGSVNANAGIPGVQPGSRGFQQPIEQLAPGFRLAYKTRWQDGIRAASKYYSRGWTFQESNFATRSLIFIDGKVVFSCQRTDAWEEHLPETPDQIRGRDIGNRAAWAGDDIGEAEGMIQTYSERELTWPADILNAFARASRQLVYQLDTDLCHGIPTAYFDWFLLWSPLKDQTRRGDPHPLTPSWSWAGWIGPSFPHIWDWYNRSIRLIRKAIRQRTWIIWYHRVSFSSPECVLLIRRRINPVPRFKSTRNFYGARIQEDRFPELDHSRVEPTWNITLANPPHYVEDTITHSNKGSGLLQFWTVSIVLRLAEPASREEWPGPVHSRHRLGIFGRSGRELGALEVPSFWWEANNAGTRLREDEREFILLCEGRDQRAEMDMIDEEEGWRYKVMLLDWLGKDGVTSAMGSIDGGLMYAERVAIGSIGKGDLVEGLGDGPTWKEIILG